MSQASTDQLRVVYRTKGVALPPGSQTDTDFLDHEQRLDLLEQGQNLADLNDVDLTGVTGGQVIVYDADTQQWVPSDASPSIAVVDSASIDLTAATGPIGDDGPVFTILTAAVKHAGTGLLDTVARSDHTHNPVILPPPQTFAATGALSSGTRTLLTYNLGPLLTLVPYDISARLVLNARNDGDTGVVNLGLRIGGSASFPRTTVEMRTVGGVDRLGEWMFVRSDANGGAILGAGSTVQITADVEFVSGDPTNVRHGHLEVAAYPRS